MSKHWRSYAGAAALMLVVFALSGVSCAKTPKVSLTGSGTTTGSVAATATPEKLRIAVSAMISPKETFEYYEQILDYVSKKTGTPVELVQRETYDEVNQMVKNRELDVAFVCTGAYVDGHDQFGMELLVAPVAYGRPEYFSYIIVPKSSPATSLAGLKGRKFAFTDPMSNTGCLVPTYMLGLAGTTPDKFFSGTGYTYSHDKSIEAVAQGVYAGAAVDSLVYDYLAATDPEFTSKTRIVEKSPPYGIPPVVVPKELDAGLKRQLREVFLGMADDPEGRAILDHVKIDRFELLNDSAYDSVRAMRAWQKAHEPSK
ncbi:MAG: phosphate/phosphite/phosphonate ABC transporter substrate-binding protein [Actinobacteria bacterium]|nr:MAG: phosphate/phosphite/phosphonate ABC transporter substrate-binding protein [Actinomycetota bacterium]